MDHLPSTPEDTKELRKSNQVLSVVVHSRKARWMGRTSQEQNLPGYALAGQLHDTFRELMSTVLNHGELKNDDPIHCGGAKWRYMKALVVGIHQVPWEQSWESSRPKWDCLAINGTPYLSVSFRWDWATESSIPFYAYPKQTIS